MKLRCRALIAIWCLSSMSGLGAAQAQDAAANPGRNLVMSKCFRCHSDSMFRDQRQDRRGWEAAIYRMIGRGALYTTEEIKLMADYLGADFGPAAKSAPVAK